MNTQEIKDAVEYWKDTPYIKGIPVHKRLKVLIDLCELYLSASDVMPEKQAPNWDNKPIPLPTNKIASTFNEGYNAAIDACQSALMKKCEGIKAVIEKTFDNPETKTECQAEVEELSSAIQQYLLGEKEGSEE